jgi:tetratricopeptide (TPR) repeat protein
MYLSYLRLSSLFSLISLAFLPHSLPAQFTAAATQPAPQVYQQRASLDSGRELAHRNPEWPSIEKHLPNPATASPADLEMQADILRARKFPEDALEFYGHALRRGGDAETIYKKVGITHLELRNVVLAQLYFQKAVKLNKKDAEAWNNLGAVEYMSRQYGSAIGDYKKAVKLNKNAAVYHSNLGMAYFDQKDYKKARAEIATALKLDPDIFQKTSATGVSAHVLSPEDRARFCLEMAKTYAEQGNEAEMLHALSKASEAGINLISEMGKDKLLAAYRNDPRILILVQNAKALRSGQAGLTSVGAAAAAIQPPPLAAN